MVSFPGSTPAGHAGENAYKGAVLENTEPDTKPEVPESAAEDAAREKSAKKARKAEGEPSPVLSVFRSRMVYMNPVTHNSKSVKVLQRRLVGLGFVQAGSDQAGLFADGTQAAVAAYQAKHGLDETGEVDTETLKAIFRNDKSVKVILD